MVQWKELGRPRTEFWLHRLLPVITDPFIFQSLFPQLQTGFLVSASQF